MKYLQPALYAEGPTDEYFLSALLERLCNEICTERGTEIVEVSPVLSLAHPRAINEQPRHERILACVREAAAAWNLLFIHADGGGDEDAAYEERVRPAMNRVMQMFPNHRVVAVIPLRETEAWGICDGDALRDVFGTTLSDKDLGVPHRPQLAESVPDPKRLLQDTFSRTHPTVRRLRRGVSPLLGALGQRVSLEKLRRLSAFQRLEDNLTRVLREQRFIT
jgi:hypothetical protein